MLCWPNGGNPCWSCADLGVLLLDVISNVFMRYLEEHIDRQYAQTDRLLYQDLMLEGKTRNRFALCAFACDRHVTISRIAV